MGKERATLREEMTLSPRCAWWEAVRTGDRVLAAGDPVPRPEAVRAAVPGGASPLSQRPLLPGPPWRLQRMHL